MHIYRLVSESTIEENILHKSDQKRQLDHLAIQSGGFNTDFLQKFNPRELLGIQGETEQNVEVLLMAVVSQLRPGHRVDLLWQAKRRAAVSVRNSSKDAVERAQV